MHKGVILLVKPKGKDERNLRARAADLAEIFLNDGYGDGRVRDWYQLGGRWTGTLTGYDPYKDPSNLSTCEYCGGTGDRKDLTPPEWKKECKGCNVCAGTGKSLNFDLVKVDDDIMPLTDKKVLSRVEEWAKDWEKIRLKEVEEGKEQHKGDQSMQGYFLKLQGSIIADEFSFESNVYDTVVGTNKLPKSFKGYWAVVVDMHN